MQKTLAITCLISFIFFCHLSYGQKRTGHPVGKQAHHMKAAKEKDSVDMANEKDSAEEIKDTVKVTFGKDIVNLRTFTGWIKDNAGKWVSSPNRIPYLNPDFNNELYNKYKIGSENIRQINIVEIRIDSVPYLAFIIEEQKGFYRDSEQEDYKYYVAADYFLIHEADFSLLWDDSMKMNKPYTATIPVYYSGLVGYKNTTLREKYMTMELNKDIRNRKFTDTSVKTYLQFGLMPVANKRGKFMRFYYDLAYARTGNPVDPFDYGVFKKKYYEAALDLFHRFCTPKSLVIHELPKNRPEDIPVRRTQEKPEGDPVLD